MEQVEAKGMDEKVIKGFLDEVQGYMDQIKKIKSNIKLLGSDKKDAEERLQEVIANMLEYRSKFTAE